MATAETESYREPRHEHQLKDNVDMVSAAVLKYMSAALWLLSGSTIEPFQMPFPGRRPESGWVQTLSP